MFRDNAFHSFILAVKPGDEPDVGTGRGVFFFRWFTGEVGIEGLFN